MNSYRSEISEIMNIRKDVFVKLTVSTKNIFLDTIFPSIKFPNNNFYVSWSFNNYQTLFLQHDVWVQAKNIKGQNRKMVAGYSEVFNLTELSDFRDLIDISPYLSVEDTASG